ncbi:DUF3443 family protein [Burkholderia sp. 22PA0106]|uniref:DUF3443 family protein n=1 Tax=Burkholderia sp. 22PA0106 TaxID=3237371 RepID=UPI0039C3A989
MNMLKPLRYVYIATAVLLASCGGDNDPGSSVTAKPVPATYADNTQPVRLDRPTIHTANTTVQAGHNRLLTSVTLCSDAAGTNCQTIDDIIVDTGSVGLKIFDYALADGGASFTDERDANDNPLSTCAVYGSGYAWGRMKIVTLKMAGETAQNLPIAVINGAATPADDATVDQGLLPVPTQCATRNGVQQRRKLRDSNGILGVGVPISDCAGCAVSTTYYSCPSAGGCQPTFIPLNMQTTQPVASFATDNNGLIIRLPSIDKFSTAPVAGQMVFGIGTQPDNQPQGVTAFALNNSGRSVLNVNGSTNPVLVDSGTDSYVIPAPVATNSQNRYVPPAPTNVAATFLSDGATGDGPSNQQAININLIDPTGAIAADAVVIDGIGSPPSSATGTLYLGLPFFLGRSLYLGLTGHQSSLGAGPLIAF